MRNLNLVVPRDRRPQYLRIADAFRIAIQEGRARPGEALPSTRALASELRVHRQTIMAALSELLAEGWLSAHQRQAYRVAETLPSQYFTPRRANAGTKARTPGHTWTFARSSAADVRPHVSLKAFSHPFASGTPDLREFPAAEFRSFLTAGLRRQSARLMDYGDPAGHTPLIKEISVYLRRMRGIQDRDIVVTNGSQEALFLLAQLLVAPGDHVGVEEYGYRPAWDALRAAGAVLVPLRIDGEGLDAEAAAAVMAKTKLKLIYTTPLHQYPTTVTMPVGRRAHLYAACVRYQVPIIEDDYDHEFHYRCHPLPPLAAQDPAGLVLYISTFSKVLFPGARIGFAALPPAVAERLTVLKRIATRQNDCILQDGLARWMRDGGFERHLRRMRRCYEQRRDVMAAALLRLQAQGLALHWNVPDGGMAFWLDVGTDADAVVNAAAAEGIFVASSSTFLGKQARARHLRLGFATQTPRELEIGLKKLGAVIKAQGSC